MRYQPDRKGIAELLKSRELQGAAVHAAERGAQWVRARAPRDSGRYAAGIRVTRSMSPRGDRVAAYLEATAPHSAAVEWGNRRSKGRHLLRSAIDVIEGRQT